MNEKALYHIRTSLVAAVCAAVVLLFRFGVLPALGTVGGVMIPFSDFFIIVGSGLCGIRYALVMFLAIFFTETGIRGGDMLSLFPLFLYLATALVSAAVAENGFFRTVKKAAIALAAVEAVLGNLFYLIFGYIFRSEGTTYLRTILGTFPTALAGILVLFLYYRFAPDRVKRSFGIGVMYTKDFTERRARLSLSRKISLLSVAEGIACGAIAVVVMSAVILDWETIRAVAVGRLGVFLFAAMLSLSVASIVNEFIIKVVVQAVQKQERKSAHLTEGFMLALAKAVDAKDHYTSGHSERVAAYSREIARRMGKSAQEQDDIYTMGLLHDIGKIGVSEAIINKNGRLTDDEFAQIKAHPTKGYEILRNVTELPALGAVTLADLTRELGEKAGR